VKTYLVSRGVSPDRLHTTSYGEETRSTTTRAKRTRRLNRRAAWSSTSRNEELMRILHTFGSALAIVLTGSVALLNRRRDGPHRSRGSPQRESLPPGTYQIRLTDDVAHRPLVSRRGQNDGWNFSKADRSSGVSWRR